MPRRKPILIGCPQYEKLVRGSYLCNAGGEYRLGGNGEFLLKHTHCNQDGGRCIQTLCVLHRYNKKGSSSWYPSKLLAMPERKAGPVARRRLAEAKRRPGGGNTDILA